MGWSGVPSSMTQATSMLLATKTRPAVAAVTCSAAATQREVSRRVWSQCDVAAVRNVAAAKKPWSIRPMRAKHRSSTARPTIGMPLETSFTPQLTMVSFSERLNWASEVATCETSSTQVASSSSRSARIFGVQRLWPAESRGASSDFSGALMPAETPIAVRFQASAASSCSRRSNCQMESSLGSGSWPGSGKPHVALMTPAASPTLPMPARSAEMEAPQSAGMFDMTAHCEAASSR
mmetsp:Transcript_87040/g.188364  ORF Transcript_87040/g.188364 Transcript_87040/m.188364 type:complete len:236 (+) Transcript_87040:197-904(+)